jgi:D-alanine-D-alanine ligase
MAFSTPLLSRKLRIGVIFGGRSCEHEVSLVSGFSVIAHLDREKYEIVPIRVTKAGVWLLDTVTTEVATVEPALHADIDSVERQAVMPTGTIPSHHLMQAVNEILPSMDLDIIFPVLHGSYGEDGTVQGLFEMANIPYVGCGVLGSALGMDKAVSKMLFRAAGLPVVNFLVFSRQEWEQSPQQMLATIEQSLDYPCFVKPANAGSSIGVTKAFSRQTLQDAARLAYRYDSKILVEQAINCRELACSVLGNHEVLVSPIGEVISNSEFYDYQTKYFDTTSYTVAPADIPDEVSQEMRSMAERAFHVLNLNGLARIDFFLDKETSQVYINEVNTLPSFTPQCMYAKLWAVSGLSYPELLDFLITLAFEYYADRQRNQTSIVSIPNRP